MYGTDVILILCTVMDDVTEEKEGEEVELDPQREAYYINDPKKALRKFFEREGVWVWVCVCASVHLCMCVSSMFS